MTELTDVSSNSVDESSGHALDAPPPANPPQQRLKAHRRWMLRISNILSLTIAVATPLCGVATYLMFYTPGSTPSTGVLRTLLIADFCLILALFLMISWRIATLILARRERSAGSRLHLRMVRLFAVAAVAPVLILGFFSAQMVTLGLQSFVSERVNALVKRSVEISRLYATERRDAVAADAAVAARELVEKLGFDAGRGFNPDAARDALGSAAAAGEFIEAFLISENGVVIARAPGSFLYKYASPAVEHFNAARALGAIPILNLQEDEVTGLAVAPGTNLFLYASRPADMGALARAQEAEVLAAQHAQVEKNQVVMLIVFAMLYLGFALMVIGAAVWFGIWFADRLSRPVGRLAAAAGRIAQGDFSARAPEERGQDEIALLSRGFNRMADEVQRQRDELLAANQELDDRREFLSAVLSGVSAGVIGMDGDKRVTVLNHSAQVMLSMSAAAAQGRVLDDIAPALSEIANRTAVSIDAEAEGRATLLSDGAEIELLVRAARLPDGDGYVVTFDDMTDLVSAQRMAAWGDVARRVAHEIKNPLTPIQLSAERLKRKFARPDAAVQAPPDPAIITSCVDTIVRQVGDIRRMVDEFSQFARMPEPVMAPMDAAEAARDVVALISETHPAVTFELDAAPAPTVADRGLITQALTNLVKNAAEAVQARLDETPEPPGVVKVAVTSAADSLTIDVSDNGIGLPKLERRRLTEPYVTTRKKGAGLGLSIVKRIAEQHGGRLSLDDAAPFAEDAPVGARLRIIAPRRGAAAQAATSAA